MIRYFLTALIICLAAIAPSRAEDAPAPDGDKKTKPAEKEATLPAEVLNYYGKVTGTVASVDTAGSEIRVKVTSAQPDAAKNKAPKPNSLTGMTITVTPLQTKKDDGTTGLDPASVEYIKGAKAGDAVTLDVRASSKGVVFRLLKVPAAAVK